MSIAAHLPQFQDSLIFFFLLSLEMALLFIGITFLVGILLDILPPNRIGDILSSKNGRGYLVGAGLGALTPFCSCSTIPMVVGMLRANAGFGPTMTFLFTSPLVNPLLVALLVLALGWKFTLIYSLSALIFTVLLGFCLEKLNFSRFIRVDALVKRTCGSEKNLPPEGEALKKSCMRLFDNRARQKEIFHDAVDQYKKFFPLITAGIGIGAFVHGFVPLDFFTEVAGADSPWAVPVSAIIGVPLYVRASAMVPMIMPLAAKGVGLGSIAALIIGSAGASLPEVLMINRLVRFPLLCAFLTSVFLIAVSTGFIFNKFYG